MPDIEEALNEIAGVMRKHGIAGYVAVSSETESSARFVFDAPWTCAKMVGDRVLVRCHAEDYVSKDAQVKSLESTINLFDHLRTMAGRCHTTMMQTISAILPKPSPSESVLGSAESSLPSLPPPAPE